MTKELLEKARKVVAELPDHPRTKTGMFKPGKTDAHPQAGMFGGKKAAKIVADLKARGVVVRSGAAEQKRVDAQKPGGTLEKAAKAKTKAETVGVVAKKLILAGKTNAQVLEALGNQFGEKDFAVGGPKRYYASWYRSSMRRAGELKAVAK